jgi:hypothetical protein
MQSGQARESGLREGFDGEIPMKMRGQSPERDFLDAAARRAGFLAKNDSRRANKEYDRIHALKDKLRLLPDRGEAALKRILLNGDP